MPTFRPVFLLLLLLPLLLASGLQPAAPTSPAPAPIPDANATAHDALALLGLPQGLLPANVVGYTRGDAGGFTVELSEPCYVQFSDLAYYERTFSGKIAYGRVSGLSGVQVKKFFVWLDVVRVVVSKDGGSILVATDFFSETHPTSEFRDVRPCQKWNDATAAAAGASPAVAAE